MLELNTASAMPLLSWKKQSTSSAYCVYFKSNVYPVLGRLGSADCTPIDVKIELSTCRGKVYVLLQLVKAKDCILKFTMFVKLRPTGPLQTIVALSLPAEDSAYMISQETLTTVISASRTWSPGKNTMVVLSVKYCLAFCAYSESVVQLAELEGQDEHEVALDVTQYTFSVEQQERVLLNSAATLRTVNIMEIAIFFYVASALSG